MMLLSLRKRKGEVEETKLDDKDRDDHVGDDDNHDKVDDNDDGDDDGDAGDGGTKFRRGGRPMPGGVGLRTARVLPEGGLPSYGRCR